MNRAAQPFASSEAKGCMAQIAGSWRVAQTKEPPVGKNALSGFKRML
jgi:hypothetical protein